MVSEAPLFQLILFLLEGEGWKHSKAKGSNIIFLLPLTTSGPKNTCKSLSSGRGLKVNSFVTLSLVETEWSWLFVAVGYKT